MLNKKTTVAEWRQTINERLRSIEELINLFLLSNVMQQLDETSSSIVESFPNNICSKSQENQIKKYIESLDLSVINIECFHENILCYIKSSKKLFISKMNFYIKCIKKQYVNVIPIFVFNQLQDNDRKFFEEKKIPYSIENKELHIFL